MKNTRWPYLIFIPILVIVIIVFWWCWWWKIDYELHVQDDDVVAFAMLNNTFTFDPDQLDEDEYYWSGFLMQIGNYDASEIRWKGVELEVAGQANPVTYAPGQFRWIDIVSDWPNKQVPILPSQAIELYPNDNPDTGDCGPINECSGSTQALCACADPADPATCTMAGQIRNKCLRNHRLHYELTPAAIVTYWHGPQGYRMRSLPITGALAPGVKVDFDLRDTFTVTVYEEVPETDPATPEVVELVVLDAYQPGDVRKITILADLGGPGPGEHCDPAWPIGKGGKRP